MATGSIILRERMSHPARGAWIEIAVQPLPRLKAVRRTPQGVRGLKLIRKRGEAHAAGRRTPQGVRGLKSILPLDLAYPAGRTPQGVRGLKLLIAALPGERGGVAPRKGCVD